MSNFNRTMKLPHAMYAGSNFGNTHIFAMPDTCRWPGWTFPVPGKLCRRLFDGNWEVLYGANWEFRLRNPEEQDCTVILNADEMECELGIERGAL